MLDHINGQRNDDSLNNLRYLCPNCDSQLETRGGGNIGRIQNQSDFGYEILNKNGTRDANVFPRGVALQPASEKLLHREENSIYQSTQYPRIDIRFWPTAELHLASKINVVNKKLPQLVSGFNLIRKILGINGQHF